MTRYCSVFKYIEKNNKPLFELIDDLCAGYLYNNNRRESTFLLPNDKLIKKMKSAKEEDALDMLKSLILKGKYNAETSSKVYNLLNKQLDDVSSLNKNIKVFKGELWGNDHKVVYNYDGDDIPTATQVEKKQGGSFGMPQMNGYGDAYDAHKIEGGSASERAACSNDIYNKYKVNKDLNCYKEKVASLLCYVKENHNDVFKSLCYVVDYNPMVTWYIFAELGKDTNLLISEEIFSDWVKSQMPVNEPEKVYNECFEYVDNDSFAKINNLRNTLIQNSSSKVELPSAVYKCYQGFLNNEGIYPEHLANIYKNDPYLKLLQDEVRFLYSDEEFYSKDECVDILHSLVWKCDNDGDLYLCNSELYKALIKPSEFFLSGIVGFVKSTAFLYVPLSAEKDEKIQKVLIGGGSVINYKGGANRKTKSKNSKLSLKALIATIKSLDNEQIEEIKSRIC